MNTFWVIFALAGWTASLFTFLYMSEKLKIYKKRRRIGGGMVFEYLQEMKKKQEFEDGCG